MCLDGEMGLAGRTWCSALLRAVRQRVVREEAGLVQACLGAPLPIVTSK